MMDRDTQRQQQRQQKQFWGGMNRASKKYWSQLGQEARKAARRQPGRVHMRKGVSLDRLTTCGMIVGLCVVLALLSQLLDIMERITVSSFGAVKNILIIGGAMYLGLFLLVLLLAPLADLIRRLITWGIQRRRADEEAVQSPFPHHEHLKNERYLDGQMWQMIDYDLVTRAARLRRRGGSRRGANRKLKRLQRLQFLLLVDPAFFYTWKTVHLLPILRTPYHRPLLDGIYNEILRRLRMELDGAIRAGATPSRLFRVFSTTIVSNAEPVPRWYVTRIGLHLLTRGRLFATARRETSLVDATSDQATAVARRKLMLYLNDGDRFREFMRLHFFKVMGELGPFEFHLPKAHAHYERAKKEHGGYKLLPPPRPQLRLEAKTASSHEEAELAEYKALAREKQEEARENERELRQLRRRHLGKLTPEGIFYRLMERTCPFEDDIHLTIERHGKQDDDPMTEMESFLAFWQEHELEILESQDLRVEARGARTPAEEQAVWAKQAALEAEQVHRREVATREGGGEPPVHPQYGYLLARARLHVKRRVPNPTADEFLAYLKRELRQLLLPKLARDRFVTMEVRSALRECEEFRGGLLSYSSVVEAAGYSPSDDRDELAIAFVEHAKEWREQ